MYGWLKDIHLAPTQLAGSWPFGWLPAIWQAHNYLNGPQPIN